MVRTIYTSFLHRHCEPPGPRKGGPMTGSAKQSRIFRRRQPGLLRRKSSSQSRFEKGMIRLPTRLISRTRGFPFSRHVVSEVCGRRRPRRCRGRREGRVRLAPAVRCAQMRKNNAQRHTGEAGNNPAFPAQWLYGLWRALLGERCTIAPVALLMCAPGRAAAITARLDASLSGVRTTRFCRTRTMPIACAGRSLTV
jgi:hypothetical protein